MMKTMLRMAVVVAVLGQSAVAQQTISGEWMLTVQEPFGPAVMRLSLTEQGDKVTGTADGRAIEGTAHGSALEFKIDNATVKGRQRAKGEAVFPDRTVTWAAVRIPPRPAQPKTHVFEPSEFHPYMSSKVKPVLRIHPGDTVRTWSVDAGGVYDGSADRLRASLARFQATAGTILHALELREVSSRPSGD